MPKDIDRMEALGIYEVAPEDFALAEYVDPSSWNFRKSSVKVLTISEARSDFCF